MNIIQNCIKKARNNIKNCQNINIKLMNLKRIQINIK